MLSVLFLLCSCCNLYIYFFVRHIGSDFIIDKEKSFIIGQWVANGPSAVRSSLAQMCIIPLESIRITQHSL